MNEEQLLLVIKRLAHQIMENHLGLENTAIIGMQPRGVFLSDKIKNEFEHMDGVSNFEYGKLDITFYRDDFRSELHVANKTEIPFSLEGKSVVLVDDVLYTGRTVRAALDALIDLGRPKGIQLAVLVDRGHRELPIRADYVGKNLPTALDEVVKVNLAETDGTDSVELWDRSTLEALAAQGRQV